MNREQISGIKNSFTKIPKCVTLNLCWVGLYVFSQGILAFSKDLWYFFNSLDGDTEFLKVKFKILKTDHQGAGIIQVWGMQLSSRQNAGAKNYVYIIHQEV